MNTITEHSIHGHDRVTDIARGIRLLILDVDGVMTDGSIILDNEGNELKFFHVRDGHGIKMLAQEGVEVAVVTGRQSKVVERRAQELGIRHVYQQCKDKVAPYNELKTLLKITDAEIACMGDDVVDIPLLTRAGLPVAVDDAPQYVKKYALMVTKNPGGRGAVREMTDFILSAKGILQRILNDYDSL